MEAKHLGCYSLKLLCFRYLWTRFVITMCTLMYVVLMNYLWNGCNMWLVMLNYCDLGCMQVGLKSFVVSVDYRVYMGSSMTVWSLRWLLSYLCSYKLVGSVILDPMAGLRWASIVWASVRIRCLFQACSTGSHRFVNHHTISFEMVLAWLWFDTVL